ncbi:hypothetical protein NC652_026801 [Populus alba x Populus x berolinensis]|nr:hypothetical protein NC652_026801 [Populus alba x Populus x berolinensis]
MFPWLAYSRTHPHMDVAKKLSKRNFHIYLCSTPASLGHIYQRKPTGRRKELLCNTVLEELHLPSLPDLPPHYQYTTKGLPKHLLGNLMQAF